MTDTHIEILSVLRHYYELILKYPEAVQRIREMKRNGSISDLHTQNCFKHFKGNELVLEISPKGGGPSDFDYNAIKHKRDENPITSS